MRGAGAEREAGAASGAGAPRTAGEAKGAGAAKRAGVPSRTLILVMLGAVALVQRPASQPDGLPDAEAVPVQPLETEGRVSA